MTPGPDRATVAPVATDLELMQAVRAHLVRHLGPPGETFQLSGNPAKGARIRRLDLPFFAPEQHVRHAVFATVGASVYVMPDGGRMEAMLVLAEIPPRARFGAVHALLASFATYAEQHEAPLDYGDVVPAEALLAPLVHTDDRSGETPTALMLVPPVPVSPDLARVDLPSGERIDVAWLLPVYAAEAELALARGAEAVMALFALEAVDPTSLTRRRLDTTRRIPSVDEVEAVLRQRASEKAPSYASEVRGDVIAITRRGPRGKPGPPRSV